MAEAIDVIGGRGAVRAAGFASVLGVSRTGRLGHPDHVMVHRIVRCAVELAARPPRRLEMTMNRDAIRAMFLTAPAAGMDTEDWETDGPGNDGNPIGTPEGEIHPRVDVLAYLERKRDALQAPVWDPDMAFVLAL